MPGLTGGTDFARFSAKTRVYLRDHEDHLALQKLRRNKQLSATDLAELERMLAESGLGGAAELEQARKSADGLGLFIRSLIGLDREAATEAFGEFLVGRTLNAKQIHFINLIVTELTQNGMMDAGRLYESPFIDDAPEGPDTLFPSADVDKLITIIRSVRATAVPAEQVA